MRPSLWLVAKPNRSNSVVFCLCTLHVRWSADKCLPSEADLGNEDRRSSSGTGYAREGAATAAHPPTRDEKGDWTLVAGCPTTLSPPLCGIPIMHSR